MKITVVFILAFILSLANASEYLRTAAAGAERQLQATPTKRPTKRPTRKPTTALCTKVAPEIGSSPGFPKCLICGAGKTVPVANYNVVLKTIPALFGTQTCKSIQDAGILGYVADKYCPIMPKIVAACGCVAGTAPTPPPVCKV
jgi:hypothetical protein